MDPAYQAQATAIGGRDGSAASADRRLRVQLSKPAALGGAGGAGTNPEQLFAVAYAACFLSSIRHIAAREAIELCADSNVTATVGLGGDADAAAALQVTLSIDLPDVDRTTAERLVTQAHEACPYSRAMRRNVAVKIVVS